MVRSRRLELPPPFGDSALNAARLPIPPRPHVTVGSWPPARRGIVGSPQGRKSGLLGSWRMRWRWNGGSSRGSCPIRMPWPPWRPGSGRSATRAPTSWSGWSSIHRSIPPARPRPRASCSIRSAFPPTRPVAAVAGPITGPASAWPMSCSTCSAAASTCATMSAGWRTGRSARWPASASRASAARAGSASGWWVRMAARPRSARSASGCAAGSPITASR